MKYFALAMKRYFDFKGRSSRPEYWYFVLFLFLIHIVVGILMYMNGMTEESMDTVSFILSLIFLIPSLAVSIRRMHDVNKSGWYILIPIYNLILYIRKGSDGDNKYGPKPTIIK